MTAGHENVGDLCKDIDFIFLLGTDNRCKCLVGNKLAAFECFLPDYTNKAVSLEIGHHWLTVMNFTEAQFSAKIQENMDLSSRYPCMTVFVFRHDHVSQRDVDIFTSFHHSFESFVVLLVRSEDVESPKPKNITHENGNRKISSHYQKKVCIFNKNTGQRDLIKQLIKCWKNVPEMQVNKHERSHMTTFEKNKTSQPQETIHESRSGGARGNPSILDEKRKTQRTDGGDQVAITGRDQTANKKNTMTIVLLGQTGSGKSATGNTILGKKRFASDISSVPVTQECQMAEETNHGINIRVIDTPDFFDESLKNQQEQIRRCQALTQPGPDVYLLVMELGRFTDGEREIVDGIKRVFGEEVVRETIILFTGKEKLKGKSLSQYIKNTNPELQQLIQTCGSRCSAFNNNVDDERQVKTLIQMIFDMKKVNGSADILEQYPDYKDKNDCRVQ